MSSSGKGSTWGAGLGVLFKVADKVDVDAGYRYMEFKESNAKVKMNTLYAGIDVRF
jgi:opacity protein-like surface antigen